MLAFAAGLCAVAATGHFSVDGLEYSILTGNSASLVKADASLTGPVVIPSSVRADEGEYAVTAIDDKAFEECGGITSVTIPESVLSIGNDAFSFCSTLAEVVVADGRQPLSMGYIPMLNAGLFADAPVATLYLGRELTYTSRRGYSPFSDNKSLASITIGANVSKLGEYMFAGCTSLKNIILLNPTPPALAPTSFSGIITEWCGLKVPVGTVEAYRSAPGWSEFPYITDGTSSLQEPQGETPCRVEVGAGTIRLSGLAEGAMARLSRIDGAVVASRKTESGVTMFEGVMPGCYVLTVSDAGFAVTWKVIIR